MEHEGACCPEPDLTGAPRVAKIKLANMVLSGNSPMKMIGKTANAIRGSTRLILAGTGGLAHSRP